MWYITEVSDRANLRTIALKHQILILMEFLFVQPV